MDVFRNSRGVHDHLVRDILADNTNFNIIINNQIRLRCMSKKKKRNHEGQHQL